MANQDTGFDPTDPHGYHAGEHHGHVIVSPFVLTNVLVTLVIFTVLTVFLSRAEIWIAETFTIAIPHWVNVVVALSIAAIKSTLVCMYFMQLKYDNPLNSLIFLFCLFAVVLFLGFSTLDLGTQGIINHYEARSIERGGTGYGQQAQPGDLVSRNGLPIVEWAKLQWKSEWAVENGFVGENGEPTPTGLARAEDAWEIAYDAAHGGHGTHHGPVGSTANQSRPRHGLTPGLFDDHADDGHGAEH